MQKPSPQFITKLERELRLNYRQQLASVPASSSWFLRFKVSAKKLSSQWLLPAMSGAFILAITVTSLLGKPEQFSEPFSSQVSQVEVSSVSEQSFSSTHEMSSSQSFVGLTNEQMAQMSHDATLI